MTALRMLWFVLKWALIYVVSLAVFYLLMLTINALLGVENRLARTGDGVGILFVFSTVSTIAVALVPLSVLKIRTVAAYLAGRHWLWLWLLPLGFVLLAMAMPLWIWLRLTDFWGFVFNVLFAFAVARLEFRARGRLRLRLKAWNRRRILATAAVVLLILVSGGYRAFIDKHQVASLKGLSDLVDRIEADDSLTWHAAGESGCGESGDVCTNLPDTCFDDICEVDWYLAGDAKPDITDGVGGASAFAIRADSRAVAWWKFHFWMPDNWIPWMNDSEPLSDPDGFADESDEVELVCYLYEPLDESPSDDHCVWSLWLRYGQYIFGIRYGSDDHGIDRDEFINSYGIPLDRYARQLVLEAQ